MIPPLCHFSLYLISFFYVNINDSLLKSEQCLLQKSEHIYIYINIYIYIYYHQQWPAYTTYIILSPIMASIYHIHNTITNNGQHIPHTYIYIYIYFRHIWLYRRAIRVPSAFHPRSIRVPSAFHSAEFSPAERRWYADTSINRSMKLP